MTEITLNTNNNNDNNFNISNDLEWNKKKQDMIINLGLTTNHVETDQTPTPTRFIRNCEKVGLFQDLQHVNPFDEEFAKAIQNSNQLNVHSTLINDSLHTPQPEIYEQIENSSKYNNIENNNDNVSSSSSSAATHQYPQYNDEIEEEEEEEEAKPLIIVVEDAENKHLKEVKIKITHLNNKNNNNREKEDLINKEKKLIQKEALRAAQNRCRKRKQRLFEEMKLENQNLKIKNAKLEQENFNLANRLQELETQLKKAFHKNNFSTLPPPSSSSASASPTIKRIIKNTTNNNNNNQKIGEITEILKPIAPKYSIPTKNKKNTILFVYPPQIIVTTPREGGNYSVNMTKPES